MVAPIAHRGGGGQHVLAFEQAGDAGFAHGQRAQHDRAVADRLVARHAIRPLSGPWAEKRRGRIWAGSWLTVLVFPN
jgi:hypothetical protein